LPALLAIGEGSTSTTSSSGGAEFGNSTQLNSGSFQQGFGNPLAPLKTLPPKSQQLVVPTIARDHQGPLSVGNMAREKSLKRVGSVYTVNVDHLPKCIKLDSDVAYVKYSKRASEPLDNAFAHKASCVNDDSFEPETYEQAMNCENSEKWQEAIMSEYNSLMDNHTWELVERTPDMKVIPSMWLFKIKRDTEGNLSRYKARLVAGGHRQVLGVDYDETFSPVSKYTTMRSELAVASHRKWKVFQLDVKTAFLHGDMDNHKIYMALPRGFEVKGMVALMVKCMYGLHQAPRMWNAKETDYFREIGMHQSCADPSLWIRKQEPKVYLCTVVDDMLITSSSESESKKYIELILKRFPGTSGDATQYSGLKISWNLDGCATISQKAHIDKAIARFGEGTKPRTLPMQMGTSLQKDGEPFEPISEYAGLIGSLLYVACSSRPDIAATVNRLSKYMSCPTKEHWKCALYLLGYLKRTSHLGINYGGSDELIGFCDSDFAGDLDNRRSHTGWAFMLYGGAICWQSKCQPTVAVSTVEAEYQAVSSAAREALWLRQLLTDFDIDCTPLKIKCDSMGAIASIKNPKITQRTKHIDVAHHFVRQRHLRGEIQLEWVSGKENVADVLTKSVPKDKHEFCVKGLGLVKACT
jgi:hypothetical protein